MYIVRMRVGEYRTAYISHADFSVLYRQGRSLVKCGKRNGCKVRFIVCDAETREAIVRFYSRQRQDGGKWMAAQSVIGKYHTHIDF